MAETPKKTRTTAPKTATAAKPRKTASKKTADGVTADPVVTNGHAAEREQAVLKDEVARLAHTYWQERGHRHGHHIEDWFRAEQELKAGNRQ
ncbi:MAG TPA: DUF2934 domain-containing protein [Terracidiphilus sp.]|jgi:hypothetical protein